MIIKSIIGNSRKADIVFHNSGRIDIMARAARILTLNNGDVIDIAQSGTEYYLYVKHRAPLCGRHDATAFRSNKSGNNFRAWSKKLCEYMLDTCHTKQEVKLCTGNPVEQPDAIYLPIIIKLIL